MRTGDGRGGDGGGDRAGPWRAAVQACRPAGAGGRGSCRGR